MLLNRADNASVERPLLDLLVGWHQADDGVAGLIYRGGGHVLPLVVL
jgi:hypothetical protein